MKSVFSSCKLCRKIFFQGVVLGATLAVRADKISSSSAEVVKVYRLMNGVESREAGLGDWLTVEIGGLSIQQEAFIAQNRSKLVLYLGDVPLKGLCSNLSLTTNTGHAELRFYLQRTDASRTDWAALLGSPRQFRLPLHVSVGLGDQSKLPAVDDDANGINFIVIREGWFWGCLVFTGILIFGVFKLATRTNALRDDGPTPANGQFRTYSLARCQMAFWLVLVLPTFLYLWLITGALDTLTSSVLVLMGVSGGTALFAHAQAKPEQMSPPSAGFIKDALKDDNDSISFHHFQMFVWTLVLGCIFVVEVWHNLAMPEFNGTLLGMMGISSGTYLGFMLAGK